MKPFKVILATLIVAVATFATAKFFFGSGVEVKTAKTVVQSYTPHISINGNVVYSNLSLGKDAAIEAGVSLNKANSDNALCVSLLVSEQNISRISLGQKAEISGVGFEGKTYGATVCKIGDKAQKITTTSGKSVAVEVHLLIDEPDKSLKPGFTAKADIFTGQESSKVIVPYSAVLQDNGGEYVFVDESSRAQKRYIKTGIELIDGYEVLSGLSANETVITTPKLISSDGERIVKISEGE